MKVVLIIEICPNTKQRIGVNYLHQFVVLCLVEWYYHYKDKRRLFQMLVDFSVKNFKLFESFSFSMKANNRITTHLSQNYVEKTDQLKVLKSAVVFGPNNTGKSTFVRALQLLKEFIQESEMNDVSVEKSFRSSGGKEPVEFFIKVAIEKSVYEYTFSFTQEYGEKMLNEEFLKKDGKFVYLRSKNGINEDFTNSHYKSAYDILGSNDNLFLPILAKANNIDYIDSKKVIEELRKIVIIEEDDGFTLKEKSMKLLENQESNFVRSLMKYSDLSIDEITFEPETVPDSLIDSETDDFMDSVKKSIAVNTIHKYENRKIKAPLIFTESLGTRRLFNLAGEIYDALKNNKIIVIDEIDNSFHTVLTRNIFNLFHMNENTEGQLIATTHDLLLLENEYLFRKDQIWFTDKEDDVGYLYTLDDFGKEDGYRKKENAFKDYMKDQFGALPNIDIVSVLEQLEEGDERNG